MVSIVLQLCASETDANSRADFIYWVEKGTSTIRRANLDGSGAEDLIIGVSDGKGMALDLTNEHIYWVERGSPGKIRRANLDGSNVQDHILGVNNGKDIALTNQYIYWNNQGTSTIRRANLDGNNVHDVVTGISLGTGIALTNEHIYWVEAGPDKIRRANLDGSYPQDLVTNVPDGNGIALTNEHIYWVEVGTKIRRANLDGSNPQDLITNVNNGRGIAVDSINGHIYWTDYFAEGKIRRANLDGSNIQDHISGVNQGQLGITLQNGIFADNQPETTGWQISISAIYNDFTSSQLSFGVANWATNGRDIYEVPDRMLAYIENHLPPLPPEGANDARFLLNDDEVQGSLADIRSPMTNVTDTLVWKLQLFSMDDVTLSWDSEALKNLEGSFLLGEMNENGSLSEIVEMASVDTWVSEYTGDSKRSLCLYFSDVPIQVSYALDSGWNLVSVPGQAESNNRDDLFPGALSLWEWDNSGNDHRYVQSDVLKPGWGYWLNLASDTIQTVVAEEPVDQTMSLPLGWSLTGVFSREVSVAQLKSTVPQIRSVFGYDGVYYLATVLKPGEGYWIKVKDEPIAALDLGQFDAIPESGVAKPTLAVSYRLPVLNAITESAIIVLELGASDPEAGALPPVPPPGSADARILLSEFDSWMTPAESDTYPVRFQEIEELKWNFGRSRDGMWSLELADGRHVALEGEGSVSLSGGVIHGLLHQTKEARQYSYDLRSNFPNPFNPTTTIGYQIGASGYVKLEIFNVLGQRVRLLVDSEQPSGAYRVIWDGHDDKGLALAAGTYFLRMQSGSFVKTTKMVFTP